jgi:hypothetical protein
MQFDARSEKGYPLVVADMEAVADWAMEVFMTASSPGPAPEYVPEHVRRAMNGLPRGEAAGAAAAYVLGVLTTLPPSYCWHVKLEKRDFTTAWTVVDSEPLYDWLDRQRVGDLKNLYVHLVIDGGLSAESPRAYALLDRKNAR